MSLINTIINHIGQRVQDNELSDSDLIELVDHIGTYFLGLKTIANKSRELGIDYNNVKCSKIGKVNLFGVRFVIDND